MKSPTALEFQNRVRSPFPVKAIDWYDYEMAADPDLGWKNKKEEIEGLRPMASTFLCTLSEAGNKVGVSPLPRALIYPLSYLFFWTHWLN